MRDAYLDYTGRSQTITPSTTTQKSTPAPCDLPLTPDLFEPSRISTPATPAFDAWLEMNRTEGKGMGDVVNGRIATTMETRGNPTLPIATTSSLPHSPFNVTLPCAPSESTLTTSSALASTFAHYDLESSDYSKNSDPLNLSTSSSMVSGFDEDHELWSDLDTDWNALFDQAGSTPGLTINDMFDLLSPPTSPASANLSESLPQHEEQSHRSCASHSRVAKGLGVSIAMQTAPKTDTNTGETHSCPSTPNPPLFLHGQHTLIDGVVEMRPDKSSLETVRRGRKSQRKVDPLLLSEANRVRVKRHYMRIVVQRKLLSDIVSRMNRLCERLSLSDLQQDRSTLAEMSIAMSVSRSDSPTLLALINDDGGSENDEQVRTVNVVTLSFPYFSIERKHG